MILSTSILFEKTAVFLAVVCVFICANIHAQRIEYDYSEINKYNVERNHLNELTSRKEVMDSTFHGLKFSSEKRIKELQNGLPELPAQEAVPSAMTEDEIVQHLNQRIFSDSIMNQESLAPKSTDEENLWENPALPDPPMLLPEESAKLNVLQAYEVNDTVVMDMLEKKKSSLKVQELKSKKQELSELVSTEKWAKRPSLEDKFYFEGILGLAQQDPLQEQEWLFLSPAIAYQFDIPFSIGSGPSFEMSKNEDSWGTYLVGLRTFSKWHVLSELGYLQLENRMLSPTNANETSIKGKQSEWLLGLGYLLKLSPSFAFNLSCFYELNESNKDQLPILFRIGISTMKAK